MISFDDDDVSEAITAQEYGNIFIEFIMIMATLFLI